MLLYCKVSTPGDLQQQLISDSGSLQACKWWFITKKWCGICVHVDSEFDFKSVGCGLQRMYVAAELVIALPNCITGRDVTSLT